MKAIVIFCLAALFSGSVSAEESLAQQVEGAAAAVAGAAELLEAAAGADDQMLAVAAAITAFENGLRTLRDSFRAVTVREQTLTKNYGAERAEFSQLLGTLYAMESQSSPLVFLHPDGPLAGAQSAQILAEVTPLLQDQAAAMSRQIGEMTALRLIRENAANDLRLGLAQLNNARAALEDAIARGEPVPALFVDDRMKIQILAATSASLSEFAGALGAVPLPEFESNPIFAADPAYQLPVAGDVVSGFGAAGADGVTRPGISVQSEPFALVTAPFDATVRFAGPFLDYGNVVILEPQAGTLLILAGVSRLIRAEGDVLARGDPIGQLGGRELSDEEFLIEASSETGVQLQQTLYIELRRDGESVDPAPWFNLD